MNQEICNKFKSAHIVTVIKLRNLEPLGSVVRMNGVRTRKNVLEGKSGAGENKRRGMLRWMDDVELDLRNVGVKKWKTGQKRTDIVLREAKTKSKGL